MEDRPRRLTCILVGDDCPECREEGLNKAVAGDPVGFPDWEGEAKDIDASCPIDGRNESRAKEGRDEVEERDIEEAVPDIAGVLDF